MGRTSAAARVGRSAKLIATEREANIAGMNAATKKKFTKLSKMIGDTREANLRFYHSIGSELLDIEEDQDKYTHDGYRLMIASLSLDARVLNKAKNFADSYDAKQLTALIKLKNKDSEFQLHWGHIDYLLTLNTEKQREMWADKAVNKMWDPPELHDHIQLRYNRGDSDKDAGGRPHKLPAKVSGQIRQIKEHARNFVYKANNMWNGEEYNVFANILAEPIDELTDVDLENLEELIELLPEIKRLTTQLKPLTVHAAKHVSKVLADRAAAEAKLAEAEENAGRESRLIELGA